MKKFNTPAEELEHLISFGMSQECCDLVDNLRSAARKVLHGLNERIDAAGNAGERVPVFDGIADLAGALTSMEPRSNVTE